MLLKLPGKRGVLRRVREEEGWWGLPLIHKYYHREAMDSGKTEATALLMLLVCLANR